MRLEDQGTIILFPEQVASNQQVSNVARSSQTTYAPQMPAYYTVPQQTNGTAYTNPAPVNRPMQNPQPIAQPANYQQSVALSPITRFRVPIVALLCVLISIIVLNSTKVLNSNKEKSKTTNTTKTYVESRDITLKIMSMPSEEPVLEEVLDDFKKNYMQEHNDINSLSINVEYNEDVPYDRAPECDVFLTSAVKSLADNKEIYPIPKDSSDKIINLVGQSMANTTFYNGDYYGFPFKPNTAHIMYYNTSLYTESEVKYLDSMLAKPLGSIKRFAMPSSSWDSSTWYLTSDLGTFTNVIYGFDSPKCVETLKFVQANNSKILINSFGWEDRAALMRDGKLAAACDGWWYYYAYKAALGENFGVTMLPILGSRQMVCWGGGQYYSIIQTSHTQNRCKARKKGNHSNKK